MALRTIGRKLQPTSRFRLKAPPKVADPELQTKQHLEFRQIVCRRAGWRCEWIENGQRCTCHFPAYRVVADHIIERADGGAPFDPANGQCLCIPHNTQKGIAARTARSRQG